MAEILTTAEVAKAIYVDPDFDATELSRLSSLATAFIKQKTGRDFGGDTPKHPLAVECAIQYVRQTYFGAKGYNRDHDYSLGIASLIVDLQVIADELSEEA